MVKSGITSTSVLADCPNIPRPRVENLEHAFSCKTWRNWRKPRTLQSTGSLVHSEGNGPVALLPVLLDRDILVLQPDDGQPCPGCQLVSIDGVLATVLPDVADKPPCPHGI